MGMYTPDLQRQHAVELPRSALAEPVQRKRSSESYSFRPVPARGLLHVRIAGFWTLETIAAFAQDLRGEIARLGTAPNQHLLCCDVSCSAIQPQEVVAAFQKLIVHGPTMSRKMALYTANLLPRMQSRRIVAVRDNVAFFETEAAALKWLIADREAA